MPRSGATVVGESDPPPASSCRHPSHLLNVAQLGFQDRVSSESYPNSTENKIDTKL